MAKHADFYQYGLETKDENETSKPKRKLVSDELRDPTHDVNDTSYIDNTAGDIPSKANESNSKEQHHSPLLYKLTDNPPAHLLILFALQQGLLAIATPLTTTFIVGEVVCARNNEEIKARILSATFFMIGLSTFTMTTFGIRLPIFQGPNFTYVIPLMSLMSLEEFKCPDVHQDVNVFTNITTSMVMINNETVVTEEVFIYGRINDLAGSLILVGFLHFLIGATGLVGIIARYVGPITIVPIVFLFGIQIHSVVAEFAETHWPSAALTATLAIILSLYLQHHLTPIPCWTPSRGFFISWQNVHNVFSIIISIIIGWSLCHILTTQNILSDDPNNKEHLARTDSRFHVVKSIDWFMFPHPGQFGMPGFNVSAAITFFIATLLSVLGSIADYATAARITHAPRPPQYALNRGIAVEGLMVLLGGAFGCGHGTVSFAENNGAMKISRVVSRSVFNTAAAMYLIFAFVGKIGAFFITIPHSVMGGSQIITFGMLIGVTVSLIQGIDLNSTRNISIMGITFFIGVMIPGWVENNPDRIDTGNVRVDTILKVFFSNPSFIGGMLACFLDNTVPGTKEERGIKVQKHEIEVHGGLNSDPESISLPTEEKKKDVNENEQLLFHGKEVYRLPWLPDRFRKCFIARVFPIFDCDVFASKQYYSNNLKRNDDGYLENLRDTDFIN